MKPPTGFKYFQYLLTIKTSGSYSPKTLNKGSLSRLVGNDKKKYLIMNSVENYARRWAKEEEIEVDTLSE